MGTVKATGKYMTSTEDQLLAIWEAMNLIEKAQECSNMADIPEILENAEIVLSNVLKELVQNAKPRPSEIRTQSAE